MNFETWLKSCFAWQSKTFGDGPRPGLVDHLRKEVEEIAANPTDPIEYIDLIFLAVDGLRRNDYDPGDIGFLLEVKLYENQKRDWPDWRLVATDKAIEHLREPREERPLDTQIEHLRETHAAPEVVGGLLDNLLEELRAERGES